MKKILLLVLCVVLISSLVEAKIEQDSVYEIPKTKVAPVIDGIQDNIWKVIDWNPQRYYNVGDPPSAPADSGVSLSGLSKAMWDANNLYILFYTIDDNIVEILANPGWNQDAIELYFDGSCDHSTETSLKAGQYQFTIPHWLINNEVGHLYTAFGTAIDTTGIEFKLRDVSDAEGFPGWMTEVKIPLSAFGVEGATAANQLVGWELQQDECDDAAAGRAFMSKWWSNSNNSWANAGIWGYAALCSREIDTVLEIVKAPTAPTIDGVMDDVYKTSSNMITTNLFRVGDPPANDAVNTDPVLGAFITAYPLWDNTNVYIFFDIVDPAITEILANAGWNQDAVEVYFDGTNDHSTETSLKAGQYQFTIPHWLMDEEVGHIYTAFGTAIDSTGIEYKITDRDVRPNAGALVQEGAGWNLEIKIPLANLGIDAATGSELGFEVQMDNSNDAAVGRGGMQKWWSESNNSWANAGIWGYAKLGTGENAVNERQSVVRSYSLDQNYPNPFNPSTQITYTIPKNERVKLSVYNILGKQVAELVNGTKNAGTYTVNFSAANLSSGVYFYKLETGNTVLSKKMMLLK